MPWPGRRRFPATRVIEGTYLNGSNSVNFGLEANEEVPNADLTIRDQVSLKGALRASTYQGDVLLEGDISLSVPEPTNQYYAMQVYGSDNFTINDGTYEAATMSFLKFEGLSNTYSAQVTINDGYFHHKSSADFNTQYMGLFHWGKAPIINGGVFRNDGEQMYFGASYNSGSTIKINGGYFSGPVLPGSPGSVDNTTTKINTPSGYQLTEDTLGELTGNTGEYQDYCWLAKSTAVTYYRNDGTSTEPYATGKAYTTYANGSVLAANSTTTYSARSTSVPYRAGNYEFLGWAATSDAQTGSQAVSGLNANASLYAVWGQSATAPIYTVNYDLNGGTGTTPEAASGTGTDKLTAPVQGDISKAGYVFAGWSLDPATTSGDITGEYLLSDLADSAQAVGGQNVITLYAVWAPKTVIPSNTFKAKTSDFTGEPITYELTTVTVNDTEVTGFQMAYYGDSALTQKLPEPPTEVGTYYVSITRPEDDTYAAFAQKVTLRIKGQTINAFAEDYNGEYDGQPHTISVTVWEPTEGYTIKYGTSRDECTLSEPPTFIDICSNERIYYKITASGYEPRTGSASVTIKKIENPIVLKTNLEYAVNTSGLQTVCLPGYPADAVPSRTGFNHMKTSESNTDGVLDLSTDKTPYNSTVEGAVSFWLTGTANVGDSVVMYGYAYSKYYDDMTFEVTITLTDKQDQAAPEAFSLVFTENADGTITAEIPEVAGAEYSFDGTTWSETNTTTVQPGQAVCGYIRMKGTEELNTSPITSETQTAPLATVKTPTASPNGGSFSGSTTVTLSCTTEGADIYYTTDGSDPSVTSTEYTTPITVTETTTIKAVAVKSGMTDSSVLTVTFTKSSGGGSSSSGGSSTPTYTTTVNKTVNGSVSISPSRASKGTTVTITVTPDDGYELETLIVTDKNGDTVKLTDKGNGKFTFTMPASAVEVDVSFQEIVVEPDSPFTDIYESDYYYDAVLWAVANGVTNGTSATTFSPDMDVTRAQAVTFQWRAAGSPVVSGSSFGDVATDAYYVDAVTWAVANGITNGTGGNTFSPDVVVSRAQAVTFLYRELG